MNTMIFDQFKKVTLYDAKVILNDPMETENVMREVERQVGIEREEALMEVPVELSRNGNKKLVTLIGLEKDSQLYKLRDMQGNAVEVPDKGLLLSERLSILLDAQVGSTVQLKSPYSNAKNNKSHVIVSGIIPQYLGLNAYMADETLLETLNQSSFTTSAILKISDEGATALRSEYKDSSTISTIEMKDESIEKYESMMQMMVSVLVILIIVGMISGFAIIYASSMITLSERQRELASMLVIGMSYKEVRQVMYLEQWYIAGVGVVMSLPILKFMIVGLSSALENDVYSIPTTMSIGSVISAAILAGLSIVIAQQSMKIQLNKIQLVEALSMRE